MANKWGESFLKSGLPLEHLTLMIFNSFGWDCEPKYEYRRLNREGDSSWFELDLIAYSPYSKKNGNLEFLVECKCVVKKDPGKTQTEDDERPVHQNFDVHIGIAGTGGRPLGRVHKPVDLEVVTPGQQQHNDAPEENEVLFCLWRNAHFRKGRRAALPRIKVTLQFKCTIFQIPPGSDQPCQDKEDKQPVSNVKVQRKREKIKPDIFVKDFYTSCCRED